MSTLSINEVIFFPIISVKEYFMWILCAARRLRNENKSSGRKRQNRKNDESKGSIRIFIIIYS